MDNKKKIIINPNYFNLTNKNNKTLKKKKIKNKLLIKPNNVKKKLIEKVKEYQKNKINNNDTEVDKQKFLDDFNNSIRYLEELKDKNIKKKKDKSLIKGGSVNTIINNDDITNHVKDKEPVYGILKGGSKPLYSEYKKTLKKAHPKPTHIKIDISNDGFDNYNNNNNDVRKKKLKDIQQDIINKNKKTKIKRFKRKIKLGKNTISKKIGVLVKNKQTRKRIREEVKILHKKTIPEIKEYLRKHNIIKIGSPAPENILRKLYTDAYLSGDIYNKNTDILLHNYINE